MTLLIAGASRGLGRALVHEALAAGHRVIASERSTTRELHELAAAHPDELSLVTFDVTDEEAIARASASVSRSGTISHIVNNAGLLQGRGDTAVELKVDELETSFRVQTLGPALVVKHFLPLLDRGASNGIQILNVSSGSGSMAEVNRQDYAYSISKCALNMYTAMLRHELAPAGVRVVAIHPGWIRTDMGGPEAPGDPADAARKMLALLDGSTTVGPADWFVGLDGVPLPL